MQVSFRQGIIKAPANFLQVAGSSVGLVIPQPDALLMTFAHGQADYLYTETTSVASAWAGPFVVGTDYWLYWDIHPTTGVISRNHTLYEPIESAVQPALPVADQHWFDTTANKMKVWNATAGRWVERIRLFAAKLTSGTILTSMSVNSPVYEGTQVGSLINASTLVGFLVYDEEGKAIRKGNGTFFTTEDVSVTGITSSAQVKLGSVIREARASANMSKHTVVVFSDFDEISPADPVDFTVTKQFGIIEQDVIIGEHVGVVTHGVLTSSEWDWSSLGVNAPLYVGHSGTLSSTPIPPALHPFAIVTGTQTIQLGTITNVVNVTGGTTVDPMTAVEQGIARLSVSAVTPSDPVVVGDNDPRMTDARVPTAHTHSIADVTSLQTTLDGKVDVAGDTMLGDLTLAADPTAPLHAATKQYVDAGLGTKSDTSHNHDAAYVNVSGDTMTGFLTLSADPTASLHAATKQYVDANAGGGGGSAPVGELVYGTGTGLGSSDRLTFDPTTGALVLDAGTVASPADVSVLAAANGGGGPGAGVMVYAGNSATGVGGTVNLYAGVGDIGGTFNVRAGDAARDLTMGGCVNVLGGNSSSAYSPGPGGYVLLQGGIAGDIGAELYVTGGKPGVSVGSSYLMAAEHVHTAGSTAYDEFGAPTTVDLSCYRRFVIEGAGFSAFTMAPVVAMDDNTMWMFRADVVAAYSTDRAIYQVVGVIARGAGAGSVVLHNAVTTALYQSAGATSWTMVATADTGFGTLQFTFTPNTLGLRNVAITVHVTQVPVPQST